MSEPDMPLSTLKPDLDKLTALVTTLVDSSAVQVRKLSRLSKALIVTVALALVAVGFSLTQLAHLKALSTIANHNAARLEEIQKLTAEQALCPLYELFLRSYNTKSPVAQADPAEYERNFTIIEQGAQALQCHKTKKGP